MPLNPDAINEILSFAPNGSEAAGDIEPLATYASNDLRLRGHQPGIARRAVQNRVNRQAAHMAAGAAQFLANRYAPGVVDDGDLDKIETAWETTIGDMIEAERFVLEPGADGTVLTSRAGATAWEAPFRPVIYELCEFYSFRHPTLRPGFQPAQGGLLVNAATLYPEAWAYLQTVEGQMLCKTEAEWQTMTTAIWHTNADGTTVGWNGIGGAPFYALNTATGALRLPDLRGMYAEAAGFDSLGVGGVHGDATRQVKGYVNANAAMGTASGAFAIEGAYDEHSQAGTQRSDFSFDTSRVVPTATKNQPRAWGALACVYLGAPR